MAESPRVYLPAVPTRKYFRCTKQMFDSNTNGTNKIRVFFDGLRYVAPNPDLPQVVANIQAQHKQGYYLTFRDLFLRDDVYYCPDNWEN